MEKIKALLLLLKNQKMKLLLKHYLNHNNFYPHKTILYFKKENIQLYQHNKQLTLYNSIQ